MTRLRLEDAPPSSGIARLHEQLDAIRVEDEGVEWANLPLAGARCVVAVAVEDRRACDAPR
jgi:hypothetical protein